jgi:hypothetical protein
MIRIGKVASRTVAETSSPKSVSLAYTYAGGGKREISALRNLASWWAKLGKTRLARGLAQLADDLEQGIAMGAVVPGDTVYHIVH